MKLPAGWRSVPLGEIARVFSGGTPSRAVAAYWAGGIPWASTTEIDAQAIVSTKETISELGLASSATKVVPAGTILMAMYGQGKTRGMTSILGIDAAMNQACAAIQPTGSADGRFLLAYLRHNYDMIRALSNAGGQENLSCEIVKKIPVVLPDLSEQRRIAYAIAAADDLVERLERAIAKKQAIKQGMMQQLLTGRTRLPGFEAHWSESTIGEQFHVQLGKRLDSAVNRGEMKRCMTNRSVRWGKVNIHESVLAPLSKQDVDDLRLASGDVLVCEGGEIGRASTWSDELPEAYYLNTLHRLRPRGAYDPRLLVALLEYWSRTGYLSAVVGQSSIAHLTKENLLRVQIPMPPPGEQSRLADLLAGADDVIVALEKILLKQRAIKQGMMQQLLTGHTRLPVETAS